MKAWGFAVQSIKLLNRRYHQSPLSIVNIAESFQGKCGVCAKVCPTGAIVYNDEDKVTTETYGAVVLATGYDLIRWQDIYPEYGGGTYPDVIDGLSFERLVQRIGSN